MSDRRREIVRLTLFHRKDNTSDNFNSTDSLKSSLYRPSGDETLSGSESESLSPKRKRRKLSETEIFENEAVYETVSETIFKHKINRGTEGNTIEVNNEASENDVRTLNTVTNESNVIENEIYAEQEPFWRVPKGDHECFKYSAKSGMASKYLTEMKGKSPYSWFRLFLHNKIIDSMVTQTNLYATQTNRESEIVNFDSGHHQWSPTNRYEMLRFIGIMGYMGLVQMPHIDSYWSNNIFYQNDLIPKIMDMNRFELLLRMWHFSDNCEHPEGDTLHKIKPLLDSLIEQYQAVYTPGETFCIDKLIMPFQNRQRNHKHDIKLFKLCCNNGYTWNVSIYSDKRLGFPLEPTNIVMNLSQNLLNTGRTIVADSFYTSLELANKLLDSKTHYVGTLQEKMQDTPKEVIRKKLQKGEVYGLQNERGICIMKWKDKRSVYILSTKHSTESVDSQKYCWTIKKPKAIIDYNNGKPSIDLWDEMSFNNMAFQKSLRYYKKLAVEFLLETTLINAQILYNNVNEKKMNIRTFREEVIRSLLHENREETIEKQMGNAIKKISRNLALIKRDSRAVKVKKYCVRLLQKRAVKKN